MHVKPLEHSFNVEIAEQYGVYDAIILKNILFWVMKNKENGKHCHDGKYWTYNSVSAFSKLFPYLSEKQIRSILGRLEKNGLIVSGNYNKSAYDRTKWYALTDKALELYGMGGSTCPDGQMEIFNRANEFDSEGEPIPDGKPDEKPTKNNSGPKRKRFVEPTIEEVEAYIKEKGYTNVSAAKWISKYKANGWMVGKVKMKDWRACVDYWHRNDFRKDYSASSNSVAQQIGFTPSEQIEKWGSKL